MANGWLFSVFPKLTSLNLSANEICSPPTSCFSALQELEEVDFRNNMLDEMPLDLMQHVNRHGRTPRVLLSDNRIMELELPTPPDGKSFF